MDSTILGPGGVVTCALTAAHRPVGDVVRDTIPNANVGTDRELLRRALLALDPLDRVESRWCLVANALGHGSGVATAICVALGIDPHQGVDARVIHSDDLDDWSAYDDSEDE